MNNFPSVNDTFFLWVAQETRTMMSHMCSVIVNVVAEASHRILLPVLGEAVGVDLRPMLLSDSHPTFQCGAGECMKERKAGTDTSSTR